MKVTRVGLDLAKRVFQVHGVNEDGRAKLGNQQLSMHRPTVRLSFLPVDAARDAAN